MNNEEIIAGTVGTVGTATGIGAAAVGASAAELTSALATVGAWFGGGMATGIGVVAAAPLAVGAVLYGVTSLFKGLFD